MTTAEGLRQMREDFLAGKDVIAGFYLHGEAAARIATADLKLLGELLEAMDRAAPGGNFHVWLDGGELTSDGERFGYVYAGKRRAPAEIGLVFATAIARAEALELALEEA